MLTVFRSTTAVLIALLLVGCANSRESHTAEDPTVWVTMPDASAENIYVLFSGAGDDGRQMMEQFRPYAAARNLILIVSPPDLDAERHDLLLQTIVPEISKRKVYVIGYAAGVSVASSYIQLTRLPVAGAAFIAGPPVAPDSIEDKSLELLMVFGEQDPRNPVDGGQAIWAEKALDLPPPRSYLRQWAFALDCQTTVNAANQFMKHEGKFQCRDRKRVVYLQIFNHGHAWPGIPLASGINYGPLLPNLKLAEIVLDYFTPDD